MCYSIFFFATGIIVSVHWKDCLNLEKVLAIYGHRDWYRLSSANISTAQIPQSRRLQSEKNFLKIYAAYVEIQVRIFSKQWNWNDAAAAFHSLHAQQFLRTAMLGWRGMWRWLALVTGKVVRPLIRAPHHQIQSRSDPSLHSAWIPSSTSLSSNKKCPIQWGGGGYWNWYYMIHNTFDQISDKWCRNNGKGKPMSESAKSSRKIEDPHHKICNFAVFKQNLFLCKASREENFAHWWNPSTAPSPPATRVAELMAPLPARHLYPWTKNTITSIPLTSSSVLHFYSKVSLIKMMHFEVHRDFSPLVFMTNNRKVNRLPSSDVNERDANILSS